MRLILVTGSRTWDDKTPISRLLQQTFDQSGQTTVIHGACPKGADRIARDLVRAWAHDGWPVREQGIPARWAECAATCRAGHRRTRDSGTTWCPSAGHRRNALMVAKEPAICLAFIRAGSAGATGCAELAERAGIPTVRVPWEDRADTNINNVNEGKRS